MVQRVLAVFLVGAVLNASGPLCFARLGETEAELEARYGKPDSTAENPKHSAPAEKVLYWNNDAFMVAACTWRGRCVQESCSFYGPGGEKMPVRDILKMADGFLKTNGGDGTWVLQPHMANEQLELVWVRSDRKAIAIVTTHMPNELIVMDQAYVEAKEALQGKP
jgi:hypothetical protein